MSGQTLVTLVAVLGLLYLALLALVLWRSIKGPAGKVRNSSERSP